MRTRKRLTEEAQEVFLDEVRKRLPQAEQALERILENGVDEEAWTNLYKFAHTLKGSGQTVGVWDIADPAFELLVALFLIKDYGVQVHSGVKEFLTERMAEIAGYVNKIEPQPRVKENITAETGSDEKRKKILVLDDDPTITGVIKKELEKENLNVIVCHDTVIAEKQLKVAQPDLIILDIILSEGDGIEFCRKIRSDKSFELIPIIFLTVKGKLQDKLAGFATGADDYLCKPFQVRELVARIKAILSRIENYQDLIFQDDLTKVYNRRYLEKRLEEEIERAKKSQDTFAVVMVDIDFFKKVNDRYGHSVGDELLQYLVDRFVESLRSSDIICRYGGEEFFIILPETSKFAAYKVLERLRKSLSTTPLDLPNNAITITISGGIASYPEHGLSPEQLLTAADSAMYRAKRAGRNKVLVYKEDEETCLKLKGS